MILRWNFGTFAEHLCAITPARMDIGFLDAEVIFQDLREGSAGGRTVENKRHPNSVALDAGFAEADVGVDADALE
uniref:Uncharacterized protein n=1 Tax=Candidatus Kentrum sp. MB TaxID=2138164 RepID=A0A451BGM3_9GAMM|nr:MAG: hypothetical protein BECKMB1821G_GA0114241_11309 [Candidatus Kentron sp. MB]VFK35675.1 MAG: hypothetical protein BECKMB1821I_GA0114274_11369 [Candidatus Kentron sp. MB]VFK77431.1 MAG: hypothetical protein BECKMB1821H_GA0114242_11379 [Candidatus Kentron sp. MB]